MKERGYKVASKPVSKEALLRSVFTPSKAKTPSGLRKRSAANTAARKSSRVKSFNALTPQKQAMLDATGKREAYLRGETTLASARDQLRVEAYKAGWIGTNTASSSIASHLIETMRDNADHSIDTSAIRDRVKYMTPEQRSEAATMTFAELQAAAADTDNLVEDDEGNDINPFWYRD